MLEPWLLERESLAVEQAKQRLAEQRKSVSAGRLIAELNFGFWTGLFNKPYHRFWFPCIGLVFPAAPRNPALSGLSGDLHMIRKLRNRVYHYEPVFHWPDLTSDQARILELLNWIDPHWQNIIKHLSRFETVLKTGHKAFLPLITADRTDPV